MRYLLLLLILFSCSNEIKYKDLSLDKSNNDLSILSKKTFNPKIEVMIFFLWPKDLSFEDEAHVIKIISTSREIAVKKDTYLKNQFVLTKKYNEKSCDCHILGLCDDGQEMDDDLMLECEEITYDQDDNNLILSELTQSHEVIKQELESIGAINIDVGMDEDFINIGTLDPKTNELHLNSMKFSGKVFDGNIKINTYFDQVLKAKFGFKVDKVHFTGDLGITEKEYNLIFQGDVETDDGYQGLIYWEHLK